MSSANAGIAMMAATSDEKNNLTATSLRWLRTALWCGAVLCPLRGPPPGRCCTVAPGVSDPRQNHMAEPHGRAMACGSEIAARPGMDAPGRGTQGATTWLINNAGPGRVESG